MIGEQSEIEYESEYIIWQVLWRRGPHSMVERDPERSSSPTREIQGLAPDHNELFGNLGLQPRNQRRRKRLLSTYGLPGIIPSLYLISRDFIFTPTLGRQRKVSRGQETCLRSHNQREPETEFEPRLIARKASCLRWSLAGLQSSFGIKQSQIKSGLCQNLFDRQFSSHFELPFPQL